MTDDEQARYAMILLLQAQIDGEPCEVAEETGPWPPAARAERQAAAEVLRIARAISARLSRHGLPDAARRKLLRRLRAARE